MMTLDLLDQMSSTFAKRPLLMTAMMTIGGIWSAVRLYSLGSFTYLHALYRSRLARYRNLEGPASWAIITGALDRIGKGFAEEFLMRGFNVVCHGRNERKLENVRRALLSQWPDREIRIMVCDAGHAAQNPKLLLEAVQSLQKLNIKVVINNVGSAARPLWVRLQDYTEANARSFLDVDCRFMTDLTRMFLPQLIASHPALIINIEIMHAQVGMGSTPNESRPVSLLVPNARQMASAALGKVGCGSSEVYVYWPHELHARLLTG